VGYAPDPISEKKKIKSDRKNFFSHRLEDGATALASNDAVQSMIFVALIPVMNYNAQIAFKRGLT
jgi:hypothetical protein